MGALQRLGEAAQGARAPWSQVQSLAGGQGGPPRSLLAHLPSRCQRPGLSSGLGTANGGLISGRVGVEEMPHVVPVTPLVPPDILWALDPLQLESAGLDLELSIQGFQTGFQAPWAPAHQGGLLAGRYCFCPLRLPRCPPAWKPSYRSLGSGDHLWERASSGLEIAKCAQK